MKETIREIISLLKTYRREQIEKGEEPLVLELAINKMIELRVGIGESWVEYMFHEVVPKQETNTTNDVLFSVGNSNYKMSVREEPPNKVYKTDFVLTEKV